jgi:YVTN family beta-propeller protein
MKLVLSGPVMARPLLILAALGCGGTSSPSELEAQGLKTGNLLVANQQDANASLIDLRTDQGKFIPVGVGPHEAQISPSGKVGVVTIYGQQPAGNQLAIIDIASGTVTRTISLGEYTRPHGVLFMPDENRVVVTSEATRNVVLVNLAEGKVEAAIPTQAQGSHMAALTADGKRVWTSNVGSGGVSEMDLVSKTFVRSIQVAPQVEGIAITPNGKYVFAGSNKDGTVSVIDTEAGTIVETIRGMTMPYRLATSADNSFAIACDPQAGAIFVIDVASRKISWKLDGLAGPRGVSIAKDGKTAFVTLADGPSVGIVDLTSRKLVRSIPVGASPDGVGYGPNP